MLVPPPTPMPMHRDRPPIVVCGVDHLGLRTIEELGLGEERVVAIGRHEDPGWATHHPDVRLVVGDARHDETLERADVRIAAAIVLTGEDDLENLHVALAAIALNPGLRIVIRLFDSVIGEHIEKLLPNAIALSSSAIAAPAYVDAALEGEAGATFELGDRLVTTRWSAEPVDRVGSPPLSTLPIARLEADRTVEPLPEAAPGDPGLVLAETFPMPGGATVPGAAGRRMRRPPTVAVSDLPRMLRARVSAPDRRLVRFATVILVLALASALFFELSAGLSPLDAFGYAISLLTGASSAFGIDAATASGPLKIYTILLSLLGAAVIAIVYALITDAIVRSRLLQTLGARAVPRTIHDHVIVCGLGSIGYRVALEIKARGVPVVVVEQNEDARFGAATRAAGIPVVAGDGRLPSVLDDVGLRAARALIAVTADDLANLTAALNARAARPDLRVVVRVFDPDFAARVRHGFGIRFTRSVTHLAAPAFAAATIGADVASSVPVGDRRVVLFARLSIPAGSEAEGVLASTMEAAGRRRLLAIVDPDGRVRWDPPADEILDAGEAVLVAATRAGLAEFIDLARPPR